MRKFLNRLHHYFIPEKYTSEELVYRKARIFINTTLITSLFALFYVTVAIHYGMRHAVYSTLVCSILFFAFALLFKWGAPSLLCTNLYLALTFASCIFEVYFDGGLYSPTLPWMAMAPVAAVLLNNTRNGLFWAALALCGIIVFGVMQRNGYHFPLDFSTGAREVYIINCYTGLVLIMFVIASVMDSAYTSTLHKLDQKNKIIEEERQKSENLLLNILPAEISSELKSTGKTKAQSYNLATVMFSDFVDFTRIGERLSPEELVSAIGEYFETFDQIIEKYGIEKIKTVGDAYICAAGLPIATTDNATIMIKVAMDFLKALEELNEKRHIRGEVVFNIRVGVNTGPLVAGVVGIKKFAYDIWGDTVNTAARLQEKGEQNKINISGTTFELIKHRFDCMYRGKIQAKNKGEIDMYFVEGTRKGAAQTA